MKRRPRLAKTVVSDDKIRWKLITGSSILLLVLSVGIFSLFTTREVPVQIEESGPEIINNVGNSPVIIGRPGTAHHHQTFLIFINGELRRLDDARYFGASPYAHIHDYSHAEIHSHATNMTFGFFLQTIGISFTDNCISFDGKESYCTNASHDLRFYIDGEPNNENGNHLTGGWQKYLITYGTENADIIEQQIRRVPDPLASPTPQDRLPPSSISPESL